MVKLLDFPVVVLAAAMAAYLLAGGLGLLLTGLVGIVVKCGPFQSASHGAHSTIFLPKVVRKMRESQTTPPAARSPHRLFVDVAICVALIVVGFMRLDSKGLIFSIG